MRVLNVLYMVGGMYMQHALFYKRGHVWHITHWAMLLPPKPTIIYATFYHSMVYDDHTGRGRDKLDSAFGAILYLIL